MISLLNRILYSALKNLFENQSDIFDFTSQTGQTEWNLAHHLANEIHKYIFWLNYDLDVIKRNFGDRRPDIIFHKRGINELNFLVVEVKRDSSVEEDIRRIQSYWMKGKLKYPFGASIKIVSANEYEVIVFDNNGRKITGAQGTKYLPISEISKQEQETLIKIIDKIYSLNQSGDYLENPQKQSQVKEFKSQIDQIVYELYNLTEEEIKIVEGFNKE